MSLESKDIKKIAHLARLAVTDEEINSLGNDLSNILQMIAKMNQANTQNVEPMAHPSDEKQPLRTDVVTETDQRKIFQQLAPEVDDSLYIVPQVIES